MASPINTLRDGTSGLLNSSRVGGLSSRRSGNIEGLHVVTQNLPMDPRSTSSSNSSSLASSPISPTAMPSTRHHSRCTTLTPREQLPPMLRTSMYTGDFLQQVLGMGVGVDGGISALFGEGGEFQVPEFSKRAGRRRGGFRSSLEGFDQSEVKSSDE